MLNVELQNKPHPTNILRVTDEGIVNADDASGNELTALDMLRDHNGLLPRDALIIGDEIVVPQPSYGRSDLPGLVIYQVSELAREFRELIDEAQEAT